VEDRVDGTDDMISHCGYGVGFDVGDKAFIFIGLIVPRFIRETGIFIQVIRKVPNFEVIDVGIVTVHVRRAAGRCRRQGSVCCMQHIAIEQLVR